MKRILVSSLAVLGLLGVASESRAQFPMQPQFGGQINQPTVSPYLQLLRGGASPGVNLFNLTVPQEQFYGGINQLQSQVSGLGQQMVGGYLAGGSPYIMPTGHPVAFGNTMWFFMGNRLVGGMGRGRGMGGMGGGMGGMGGMGMGGMGMGGMGMGMGGMGMGGMGMGMGMGMGGMGGLGGFGMMGMGAVGGMGSGLGGGMMMNPSQSPPALPSIR